MIVGGLRQTMPAFGLALLFWCFGGSVAAQPAPSAANPQIEELQKQNDELRRQLQQLQARPAANPAPAPPRFDANGCTRSLTSDKRLFCPGWVVQVSGGPSAAPVGRFVPGDFGHFQLNEHQQFFTFNDRRIAYDGEGELPVIAPTQYSFVINGYTMREPCSFRMSIDDQPIINSTGRGTSAAATLPPGVHKLSFHFECQQGYSYSVDRNGMREYPRMELLVLPPGESYPRPLRPQELFHPQPS